MTDAQRKASIARHSRFLTPAERADPMPPESELLAVDRAINAMKRNGSYDRLRDEWAIRDELNRGGA